MLAAEERGWLRRQIVRTGVKSPQRRELGREVCVEELKDALRTLQVAQGVLPEVAQPGVGR